MSPTDPTTACRYSEYGALLSHFECNHKTYCLGKRYSLCDRDVVGHLGFCCRCRSPIQSLPAELYTLPITLRDTHPAVTDGMLKLEPVLYMCHACRATPYTRTQLITLVKEQKLSPDLQTDSTKQEADAAIVATTKTRVVRVYMMLLADMKEFGMPAVQSTLDIWKRTLTSMPCGELIPWADKIIADHPQALPTLPLVDNPARNAALHRYIWWTNRFGSACNDSFVEFRAKLANKPSLHTLGSAS